MSIFNDLKVYASEWEVANKEAFEKEDLDRIKSASVVAGDYGNCVCMVLTTGGRAYIPLDRDSQLTVGEKVDLSNATIVTLKRDGSTPIKRIRL